MARKKNKKPVLHYDEKGQFRWETYFVRGRQKRRKIRTVEGTDPEDFIRENACDIWLHQEGYYEILHEREMERNQRESGDEDQDDRVPF